MVNLAATLLQLCEPFLAPGAERNGKGHDGYTRLDARWFARAVVRGPLREAPPAKPLTLSRLLVFYIPLALTPLLNIMVQPISSIGIARMPSALENLATFLRRDFAPPMERLLAPTRFREPQRSSLMASTSGPIPLG